MCFVLLQQFIIETHILQDLNASLAEGIATDLVSREGLLFESEHLSSLLHKVVAKAGTSGA